MQKKFVELYNQQPLYSINAPGRVNIIGDHTDYNDGFVLPMAINLSLNLLFCENKQNKVNIFSTHNNELKSFSLDNIQHEPDDTWIAYVKGVAFYLKEKYPHLSGFNAIIQSTIPQGAGLSSSAALELAVARAFTEIAKINWHPITMSKLTQKAENEWVGVNCGIMDQIAIAAGKKDFALLIDCRELTIKHIPLPTNTSIVIMDTMTRRDLVSSAYNERRQYCEQAAKYLNISSLRDIEFTNWHEYKNYLPEKHIPYAYHVVTENYRVLQAVSAMQENNPQKLGELMNESHLSLKNDFAASNQQLDIIVELAQNFADCYGARMTGGGFGGCAVALVKKAKSLEFTEYISKNYHKKTSIKPQLYICNAANGVSITKTDVC